MFDAHLHFTGALPASFLDSISPSRVDESAFPRSLQGYQARYSSVQQRCAKLRNEAPEIFFRDATRSIVLRQCSQGVGGIELIAGAKETVEESLARFSWMVDGYTRTGLTPWEFRFQIRVAFIRRTDGRIGNVQSSEMEKLIECLFRHQSALQIVGFDFCGEENPENDDETIEVVKLIQDFYGASQQNLISVHACEDQTWGLDQQLSHVERLLSVGVSRIGHGATLWKNASITGGDTQVALEMLERCAKEGVSFDICPTSNISTGIVDEPSDIPVALFRRLGVKYTVCTDSSELLGTSLRRELALLHY